MNKKTKTATKASDLPATQGGLDRMRVELKSDIAAVIATMNSKFKLVDASFHDHDARFDRVDARFDQMDAKLNKLVSVVERVAAQVEEQNHRNKAAYDSMRFISDRQDRLELDVDQLKAKVGV